MIKLSKIFFASLIFASIAAVYNPLDLNAADDDKLIKYRKVIMEATASHITAIASVVRKETNYTQHVNEHALAISKLARMMPDSFKQKTNTSNNRAKLIIWDDWEGFVAASKALEKAALKLSKANSKDADSISVMLGEVGATCGACHKVYRKPAR